MWRRDTEDEEAEQSWGRQGVTDKSTTEGDERRHTEGVVNS